MPAQKSHEEFDVFLSYNSKNRRRVKELAAALMASDISPWLDYEEIPPGALFHDEIEKGLESSKSAIVAYGDDGSGPWQNEEVRALLSQSVAEGKRVIPVILDGAPENLKLPAFLAQRNWVDLRQGLTQKKIDDLYWGIKGQKRQKPENQPPG